jgi:hypothetical protein
VKPSASVGTMNSAGLRLPVLASSVRATTSTFSTSSTPEMNVLPPLRRQPPSSSRYPVVVIWCEFEPASDSVMEKAMVVVPSAMPGSHRFFCSSVPYCAMIVPTIAGETTISNSGLPAAASSSQTAARSPMSPPPPPYSSGTATPR